MKLFLRLAIFLLALGVVVWGWPRMKGKLSLTNLPISVVSLPEWTEEKVLATINDYRQEQSLGVLAPNEKLNMAARARLAVLLAYEDVSGELTGLSREKSLDLVGYNYSWVGDLSVLDLSRSGNIIDYWKSDKNALET